MAAALALLAGASAPAGASAKVPGIPWTELLPAFPTPPQQHPNRVAHCRRATIRCVEVEIERMEALRERLGCDFKAVFATTYLELTRTALRALRANPGLLRFPKFFFREDALFANVYFRTLRHWERGKPVPEAWRIAFETAERGEVTGAQDMLLGINAHVQNDMPFVLAALGLRDRQGRSRKPGHDRFNDVLSEGYAPVVRAVGAYDETIRLTNPDWLIVEDMAGLELVRLWRETVWRNAEQLANARSPRTLHRVAQQIQGYAATWARTLAAVQVPGLRAARLEWCESQLGISAP